MNAPQPISTDQATKLKKLQKKREQRDDTMYFLGAGMIAGGLGMLRPALGMVALGFFVLLMPALAIVSSFIRGIRTPTR